MGIAGNIMDALPGIRRLWRRHKWSSLDVPAGEWAKLDGMVEDLHDAMCDVQSVEKLIRDASFAKGGHGMSTRTIYRDAKGKENAVNIVIDGTDVTDSLMRGYQKQMDAYRREMMDIVTEISRWGVRNTAAVQYEHRPLRIRVAGAVRYTGRIAAELSKARKGRNASEFLRYALLDREAREKRLAIEKPPEHVKLEKPEPEPLPEKPKNKSGTEARKIAALLSKAFREQGIYTQQSGFKRGRTVVRYSLRLDEGQKLSKAENATAEIASRLGVASVAISRATDKEQTIYVDVPNANPEPLLYKDATREPGKFFVGESIEGEPVFADMETLCHVLIAGTTGSGKSTFLNTLICSMIQEPPSENQFLMIDPKMVELTPCNGIPHLERPVVTDAAEAVEALADAAKEMDERYRLFMEVSVKKLSEYNAKAAAPLPRLIIVIDELADLMITSGKEVESSIVRIAQKGRAAGVHLLIATQRPTKEIVTGLIKANIPSRIAFSVASAMESRIILDEKGAENLCGKGDMIFKPVDGKAQRLQAAYISNEEIARIVKGAKENATLY